MKITFLFIFCFISFNFYSQDLKKYKGEYKNGNAIYEYFENENYERIYQGDFKYENDELNYNTVVFGAFQNNIQNGEWYYKRFHKHSANSIIILGNYKNGQKNGIWTYNQISEPLLKKKNEDKTEQNVYFIELKEDTLINDFSLRNIKGKFNNKGHFKGKWIASDGNYEFIAEFKKNTLIKLIERKKSTGEIISKYIPQNIQWESTNFYSKYTEYKDDVYGLETNGKKRTEQIRSINRFLKFIRKEFSPFNSYNYVFLKGIDFNYPKLIFKKNPVKKSYKKNQDNYSTNVKKKELIIKEKNKSKINKYYGNTNGESNYNLAGRKILSKHKKKPKCQEKGNVVVNVIVNKEGKVIKATTGAKGTTNTAPCILKSAEKSALKTKWNADSKAPSKQKGTIIFKY